MSFPSFTKEFHRDTYPAINTTRPELSAARKVVFITGGGQGIGAAIAKAFSQAEAADIIITGRKQNTLSSVKSSIEALPGNKSRVHTFVVDISNETKINDVFAEVVKNIGRVNIYVANAGCFPDPGKFAEVSIEELWRGFEINVKGLMIGARAFLKSAALSDAVFINLSTAAVHFKYFAPHVSYVSSKIAATRIIDYIAEENPHIRFYNMQPGLVLTEMAAKTQMDGTRITLDTAELPAHMSVWLASPEAGFLKGRFLYANWDVEEMRAKKKEIVADPDFLTLGLNGLPFEYSFSLRS